MIYTIIFGKEYKQDIYRMEREGRNSPILPEFPTGYLKEILNVYLPFVSVDSYSYSLI